MFASFALFIKKCHTVNDWGGSRTLISGGLIKGDRLMGGRLLEEIDFSLL